MNKYLLLVALFFNACTSDNNQIVDKDNVIVGVPTEVVNLAPYGSNDTASARVRSQIFEHLIDRADDGSFIPVLATGWKYVTPTILEVTIRSNVLFQNGETLTAEDVKYSFDIMLQTPEIANVVRPIKQVNVVAPLKVQIVLKAPFAAILAHLAHSAANIINEKAHKESLTKAEYIPVGTGPFSYVAWNRGQNIFLKRFDNYWEGTPKLATVEFRVIPELSIRMIALETGDIDIAYDIEGSDKENIIANPDLLLVEKNSPRVEFLVFNMGSKGNPLWKDKRIRQAVDYAIDRDGIIKSVLFGSGSRANSLLHGSVIGHNPNIPIQEYNVAKAKSLLQEVSIPKDAKVTIWASESIRSKIAEIIQANLEEIGIPTTIEVLEWSRYLASVSAGDYDVALLGWAALTRDADNVLYTHLHSISFGKAGNRSFYKNDELDKVLDLAKIESDSKKRDQYYARASKINKDEVLYIPLYHTTQNAGIHRTVKGFSIDPSGTHYLKTVYF